MKRINISSRMMLNTVARTDGNNHNTSKEGANLNQNKQSSEKDRIYHSNSNIRSLNYDFIKERYQLDNGSKNVTEISHHPQNNTDSHGSIKSQEDNESDVSEDSVCDNNDQLKWSLPLNPCEHSTETVCTTYQPQLFRCNTCPANVYPDLLSHVSFEMLNNETLDEVKEARQNISIYKTPVGTEDEDEEDDTVALPNTLHQRMHYLENVVVMAPKRNSFGDHRNSLPTTAPLVNLNDLARLQELHEKAKAKKGSRKSIGKSVLNRLSKSVTSVNDHNDAVNNSNTPSNEVTFEVGPPNGNKKQSRKKLERKSSAVVSSTQGKKKSLRMGRRLRRTFTSGSDKQLQQAVVNNDLEKLQKLLVQDKYMDEINYLEPPGVTVFHQACVHGDFQVVGLLINKGADIRVLTWSKLSPLKIAVMFGHYEIAELLLDSGADLKDIVNGLQDQEYS